MRTSVVVIGAGQTGLAVSYFLSERDIEHVILERGSVGQSWRSERWDSLRLLTPNSQSRLPGHVYDGNDPDGFMTMTEVVGFLDDYARRIAAPVRSGVTVTSVRRRGSAYQVGTDDGTWDADAVVIATGACNTPRIPAVAEGLPDDVVQVTPADYRNPDLLPEGGVLVVGASASGAQIASEVQRSGRQVTLAVGEHVRVPRTYRGRDLMWWMEVTGRLDERYDDVDDIVRARHLPSTQLVGTPERVSLDLNTLTAEGVRLAGRLAAVTNGRAQFSGSLRNVAKLADLKERRLLEFFDEWAVEAGLDGALGPVERYEPTRIEDEPPLSADFAADGIRSVVWATGYLADHSFVDIDVLDRKGQLKHDGGVVTASPGLYRIGLPVLRRRKSTFIHGAGDDARDITEHLAGYLASVAVDEAECAVG
ncbi:flavin-containing monooxygenase [Flexivirga oryzae]|uniref:Putative flavoprotein involved in K+ transport n=1 Tax=Flexivirga oryzae TaxID=1794944 RepID=A0A839N8L0_9MICO|nr:NAD(P)/FAD-dependent oxidoreductase [Flexivirga oryzae]MBB2890992.1 putative flavoprotein involved in K+ transport [Flexivirga oryzae]